MRFEDEAPVGNEVVRSFLVTGGKASTGRGGEEISLETLIAPTHLGRVERPELKFERGQILDLLGDAQEQGDEMSVAEVSAHLGLPMLSTITLVAQLVDDGLLDVESTTTTMDLDDLQLIRDAIAGLRGREK